jgi:tetratricopeptide (TPR) repeat protein
LALNRLDEVLKKKSIIDAYLRKKYIEFLLECQAKKPELGLDLVKRGEKLAKEAVEIQPYCTRTWINLAAFALNLLKQEKNPEIAEELKSEVFFALERAHQLSSRRQEVFVAQITADLLTGQYQKAKERAGECINLNSRLAECHWLEGLSEIFLGDFEKGKESFKMAEELGYSVNSQMALEQMAQAYAYQKNYQELVEIFQKLIQIDPPNLQYQTSLAFIYKQLGKIEEAKKEALKILELFPTYEEEVREFLRSLAP